MTKDNPKNVLILHSDDADKKALASVAARTLKAISATPPECTLRSINAVTPDELKAADGIVTMLTSSTPGDHEKFFEMIRENNLQMPMVAVIPDHARVEVPADLAGTCGLSVRKESTFIPTGVQGGLDGLAAARGFLLGLEQSAQTKPGAAISGLEDKGRVDPSRGPAQGGASPGS